MKTPAIFAATLILVACGDAPDPSPANPRAGIILLDSRGSRMSPSGCTSPLRGGIDRIAAAVEVLQNR